MPCAWQPDSDEPLKSGQPVWRDPSTRLSSDSRKTIQEIAADHAIHPIQVSQWKKQLLEGASELFTRGKKSKDKEEGQAKEAELFQQIGRLQMELEWLKKKSQLL